jgi:hypothetical protein
VGQDEDAQPLMRRADLSRREQARRRRVAQSPKLSQDGFEAEGDMPGDVLEEDPFRAAFADDAGDVGPEVAGIVGTAAFPGCAERLTWVSGKDGVKGAAEGGAIKRGEVVPYGRGGKVSGPLGSDEHGARPVFPLDEGASVESRLGEHEAQIKASAACAEGQSVPGT